MMDFLLAVDWSQLVIPGIMTFGGALLVWYRKKVKEWRHGWARVLAGLRAIPELQQDVKGIRYFVSPNGGGSLMDSARRMEAAITTLSDTLVLLSDTVIAENDTDEHVARFHCSAEGSNVYVNQAYARWIGVGKADLLGWGFLNVVHPEDVDGVESHWEQCRKERRQYKHRHRVITTTGKVLTLDVTCTPIPETGTVRKWIGYAHIVETSNVERAD